MLSTQRYLREEWRKTKLQVHALRKQAVKWVYWYSLHVLLFKNPCYTKLNLTVKWTKISTFFILVHQFEWNLFNKLNQINILWSFSSTEASISEIFAIKNCYFLALIFVKRSEKLSGKKACDVNVGQVKKSGKFKTMFFESTWRRNDGGLCGHKPGKNKQFFFKSCKLWL